jgi:hypothetical protein
LAIVGKGKYVEQEIKDKDGKVKGYSRYARIGAAVAQEYFAFPFKGGDSLRVAIDWDEQLGTHLLLVDEKKIDEIKLLQRVAPNLEKMQNLKG